MERNAWWTANEVAQRMDDAPVLSTYIQSFVTERPEMAFFFNKPYIDDYRNKAPSKRMSVPGSGYISKVVNFMESHYDYGELYMEFIHGNCINKKDKLCENCERNGWNGPQMQDPIPRPIPDKDSPGYHYKSVFNTPTKGEDGQPRKVDDFQPRANIRAQFAAGRLKDPASIRAFASEFIVDESQVKRYIDHLKNIDQRRQVRSQTEQRQRQVRLDKSYSEYDWAGISRDGKLGKLRVYELKKYMEHHDICLPGAKKDDMIKYITEHLSNIQRREPPSTRSSSDESSDEESNSDDDLVDGEIGSSTDEDD